MTGANVTTPLLPTVMLSANYTTDLTFAVQADARGLRHEGFDRWPAAPGAQATDLDLPCIASISKPAESHALYEHADGLAWLVIEDGSLRVYSAAATPAAARTILEGIRALSPPYASRDQEIVPVTFWTATMHGGRSLRRDIDAASWDSIAGNYPRVDGLGDLMAPDFRPGVGGQLVLWHGEPGTGKTTALRALAREWRDWCDLHYIVDPEVFFGSRADYMMEVMTADVAEYKVGSDAAPEKPRWRMLVLEDCGELLQPDAKREVGQALARLLNACDGLIGRGLRILVLLTTNEPAEKLHEAVSRPGRCAARIEFPSFDALAAERWLKQHGIAEGSSKHGTTLADLYAEVSGFRERRRERVVGFAA